uniref:Cytolethal distending toxin B n=1 Tax=Drosophila primaeva TaxID=46814 RepID=A0A513TXT0_9MUSC|nr:cytolethal distending toxin B [Drosophila primaeva]
MNIFVLVFGLLFAVVASQDFRFLTWNTGGSRWNEVKELLSDYEVLGIQEAGRLPTVFGHLQPIVARFWTVGLFNGDIVLTPFDSGVTAYMFLHNNVRYYMYYYDRIVEDPQTQQQNKDTRKQNLAIISRQEAQDVYVIPPHSSDWLRLDVNRPIIGINYSGSIVFTTHTDPNRATNEIDATIAFVARFMTTPNQVQKLWILMGDFNALPESIHLPQVPQQYFINSVYPLDVTRPNRSLRGGTVIDYAICGGPIYATFRADTIIGGSSDHFPVAIQMYVEQPIRPPQLPQQLATMAPRVLLPPLPRSLATNRQRIRYY